MAGEQTASAVPEDKNDGGIIVVTPKGSKKKKTYIWMPDKNGDLVKTDSSIIKKSFAKLPKSAVNMLQQYLINVEGKAAPTRAQRQTLWNNIIAGAEAAFAEGEKKSPWDVLNKMMKTAPDWRTTSVAYTEYDDVTADALLDKVADSLGFDTSILTDAERSDFLTKINAEAKASGRQTQRVTKEGVVETITTPSVFDGKAFAEAYIWSKVNTDNPKSVPSSVLKQVANLNSLLRSYGIKNLSTKEINQFGIDIVSGKKTIEELKADFQAKAIQNYPKFADRFAANPNLTVRDVAEPIINIIANAWERDPDSIELDDPEIDKLLRPDGVIGKAEPASTADAYYFAVMHPNFDGTVKGNQLARDGATSFARAMGFGVQRMARTTMLIDGAGDSYNLEPVLSASDIQPGSFDVGSFRMAENATPMGSAISASPVVDERTKMQTMEDVSWVTNYRTGMKARVGTKLAELYAQQNAAAAETANKKETTEPKEPAPAGYKYVWHPFAGGGGEWRLVKLTGFGTDSNGNPIVTPDPTVVTDPNITTVPGPSGSSTTDTRQLAVNTFKNTLALFFGQSEMGKPWVDEVFKLVSGYYKTGSTTDEALNLAIQEARSNPNLTEFTKRFKGIYALTDARAAGKPVIVPTVAEYFSAQAGMADVLRQSNLSSLATEDFLGDLIGKGISVTTLGERVVKVFDRIDNAPKAIKDTFSRFFPTVDRVQLATAILGGEKSAKQLEADLAGYEVLAAAEQQGLGATQVRGGLTTERAMEYARQGLDFATGRQQFGRIAQALPTEQKLAEITGVQSAGQLGLEKAVIEQNVQAQEDLRRLTEREEARFSAKPGTTQYSLASQRRALGLI